MVPAVHVVDGVQSAMLTVKSKLPCVVGAPANPPVGVKARPGGSEPDTSVTDRDPCPPMIGIGGCPSNTTPSLNFVDSTSRFASTKIDSVRDAICPTESVACTVKEGVVPYRGGVPLSTPSFEIDNQLRRRSAFVFRLHVTAPVAPPTFNC